MKINLLTTAEEHLMQIIWKLNFFYLKDIISNHPEPKPHQNTISTYLKILVEKEFLRTEKEGRIFKYTVIIPLEDYKMFLTKNLIKNYFNNSGSELLKTLIEVKIIENSDIQPYVLPEKKGIRKETQNSISDFIEEITSDKKKKTKKKKKKNKKL